MLNEQTILTRVNQLVPEAVSYFYSGTLFIEEANDTQANNVLVALNGLYDNKVKMSAYGFEYAYDFI